jgi:hypothetical protein
LVLVLGGLECFAAALPGIADCLDELGEDVHGVADLGCSGLFIPWRPRSTDGVISCRCFRLLGSLRRERRLFGRLIIRGIRVVTARAGLSRPGSCRAGFWRSFGDLFRFCFGGLCGRILLLARRSSFCWFGNDGESY